MAEFESEVEVCCPPEMAYDFLAKPANVLKISPPDVGLTFLSAPEVIQVGDQITFRIQSWGQVFDFTHEILQADRPGKIVEKQVKGLFQKWHHEHDLVIGRDGLTRIVDRIEFEPPSGILGFMMTKKKIIEMLEDSYHHRHKMLKKLLET